MSQRNCWASQVDLFISSKVEEIAGLLNESQINWNFISRQLKLQFGVYKTPKQCSNRWSNHIKADRSTATEWKESQIKLLFELQALQGNKWKTIADKLSGRSNIQAKACFYATLRKRIRLVNTYISMHRQKLGRLASKHYPQSFICKVIAQDQGKTEKLRAFKPDLDQKARIIKNMLMEAVNHKEDEQYMKQVICALNKFNQDCRKVRRRRKVSSDQSQGSSFKSVRMSFNRSSSYHLEAPAQIRVDRSNLLEPVCNNYSSSQVEAAESEFSKPIYGALVSQADNTSACLAIYDPSSKYQQLISESSSMNEYVYSNKQKKQKDQLSKLQKLKHNIGVAKEKQIEQINYAQILQLPSIFYQNNRPTQAYEDSAAVLSSEIIGEHDSDPY